ncbi:hypothetical protein PYW07_010307 [Mythimna separata]|uniref:Uncharacterized protein n=1 Tax=Mythimna separata TaxID=271217 RepID=A0AAD7YH62_MYTSE|nr:hypothetical protein PYW07_010307 [Mythimna separata]
MKRNKKRWQNSTMTSAVSLLPNDSNFHPLLEPPLPPYTSATLRRAGIVWLHCGKQNDFQQVCNYFHYLESMEEKLSVDARVKSRIHEFNLMSGYPPTSHFLCQHFPKLYRQNKVSIRELRQLSLEDCVFNVQGFHDMKIHKGTTTKFLVETSQMIKLYSKTHGKPLKTLLNEFQDFAKKTEAKHTVDHMAMYIKQQFLKDELVTWSDMPRTFSFLDLGEADTLNDRKTKTKTKVVEDTKGPTLVLNQNLNADTSNIKMLINESRKKEFFNMLSNYKDLAKFADVQKENSDGGFHEMVHKME